MFRNRLIALLAILVVPVIGFFLLKSGMNHYVRLHFFGPKRLSGNFHLLKGKKIPDTLYHRVRFFEFKDQDGKPFGSKELDGNPYVGSLFFTRCPDVCLRMNANIDSLYRKFKVHPEVKFVSITVDPTFDTVPVLKAYARKMQADSKRWKFLTANKDSVYRLAREGFLLDAAESIPESETSKSGSIQGSLVEGKVGSGLRNGLEYLIHSQMLVLVDGERHIRGYYDGTQQAEWKRLMDELIVLRLEQMRAVINQRGENGHGK